jgi:HEAT repeat protein
MVTLIARRRALWLPVAAILVAAGAPAAMEGPAPQGTQASEEVAGLAAGWALLASGKVADAAADATALLGRYPRNVNVLTLAVEAEIARGGSPAGLDLYERWLGSRTFEEPGILRRIALTLLEEIARQPQNPRARLEALRALAADGDTAAAATLSDAAFKGSYADARVLAALGDEKAVNILVAGLNSGATDKLETIKTLSQSHSQLAVRALIAQAKDPEPAVRQAAVAGLGQLGGSQALDAIRPALQDPNGLVRGQAAGALYRLGDNSGLALLTELAASESPDGRLAAAQYMASRPDSAWLSLVRELAHSPKVDVRLAAARLLAPHDPDAARAVFDGLAVDPSVDLAVREEATRTDATVENAGLSRLRSFLRKPDRLARVAAANRLLELTR